MPICHRKLPDDRSFGVQFGRLIRSRRAAEGYSQEALAARAELTKAKISDLETGKVGNPHAKTVDALVVALNISPEERATCYPRTEGLPPLLLETLALRFGFASPDAAPEVLEAFLREKAIDYTALESRLDQIRSAEGEVAAGVAAADEALAAGDFQHADQRLQEAEQIQLSATTLPVVAKLSELRSARAQAALLSGDVEVASAHWAAAASYFHPFDRSKEAEASYAACDELRGYGYRYQSVPALLAAEAALLGILGIWTPEDNLKGWCRATNALGATRWRLAHFDEPSRFSRHALGAEFAFQAVRAACSKVVFPYYFAASSGNLATLYCELRLSASDDAYVAKVRAGIEMQLQALEVLSKDVYPLDWGIFQHNLGTSYAALSRLLTGADEKIDALNRSISHAELSFEVRDPKEAFQYWLASTRTLAEGLIDRTEVSDGLARSHDMARARTLLMTALDAIDADEHPHQWAELQDQLARIPPEVR